MKKIIAFWKWFRENELAFLNAVFLGLDGDAVYGQFDKKLKAVSTVIGFAPQPPKGGVCEEF